MTPPGRLGPLGDRPPRFVAAHARRVGSDSSSGSSSPETSPETSSGLAASLAEDEVEHGLTCRCGHDGFRVLGVPVVMGDDSRGYVLRSVLRLWRELRESTAVAAADRGPALLPPIALDCGHCGTRVELVASAEAATADGDGETSGRSLDATTPRPLEAHRCRPCRRSDFSVSVVLRYPDSDVGSDAETETDETDDAADAWSVGDEERFDAWRLVVRCESCGALGAPYAEQLRSDQQRRLDRLYGREHDRPATRPDEEDPS